MRHPRIASLIAVIAVIACIPIALASGASTTPPSVTTAPATGVGGTHATLNGNVNPNGQQTSYAFQWGQTSGYGHETKIAYAGAGTSPESESAALADLTPGSVYHFRIIAINASGTSVGTDMTFTTTGKAPAAQPAPSAKTGPASNVNSNGATVSGTVTPAGNPTTYYFEYGPTANYGFETLARNAGSGHTAENVTAALNNLAPNTTYHYRLVAVSGNNTALGGDAAFTTFPGNPIGSRVSFIGREGFVSPGRVIGVEAACLGGETSCTGHVAIRYRRRILGQRFYDIAPNTGGFQNIKLSYYGERLLRRYNHVFHLLPVSVDIVTSHGQHESTVIHLARWVWR